MRIDEDLARSAPDRESVLAIGVFDGVHRGHRHLIDRLVSEATRSNRLAGVVTFLNHPASVLRPDFKARYLTSFEDRVRLLGVLGADFVVSLAFDLELSKLGPREFLARLMKHLRMRGLVFGPDFALGHKREGRPETLRGLGTEMGFTVNGVDLLIEKGEVIKSTTIRQVLDKGDVTRAAEMLGRRFALAGKVVTGVGRGKTLGFPTANLAVSPEIMVPGDGIYATWAETGGKRYMAATSIGTRPTFRETGRTVEAFILNFDGDLYGTVLSLEFARRLRDEVRFKTPQALKRQIDADVDQTREVLGVGRPGT